MTLEELKAYLISGPDKFSEKDANRFISKIQTDTGVECWDWEASKDRDGYGGFTFHKEGISTYRKASRLVCRAVNNHEMTGLVAMHSCDRPCCVNPAHLSIGSYSDNFKDAKRKGVKLGRPRKIAA